MKSKTNKWIQDDVMVAIEKSFVNNMFRLRESCSCYRRKRRSRSVLSKAYGYAAQGIMTRLNEQVKALEKRI
jgi:hypothetical protein